MENINVFILNDPKLIIAFAIMLVALLYLVCVSIYRSYKRYYFKSRKFVNFSNEVNDTSELYENMMKKSEKLKKSLYADFSPADPTIKAQDISKINKTHQMLPRVYMCDSKILSEFAHNKYGILKKYCWFTGSESVIRHIKIILNEASELETMANLFKQKYEQHIVDLKQNVPFLIRLFSKKYVLLMLGIQIDDVWEENLYPIYVFQQKHKSKNDLLIRFDPKTVNEIVDYLQKQYT